MGNKKKKEKKPDKKIMKIKKEKINRHSASEEHRVCTEFYIYIDTCVLYFPFYKNVLFLERTISGGRMG